MHTIRPFQLFSLVESEPMASVMIPRHRGFGGTSLLETMLIIAGIKLVNAHRVFEFGTFLGSNTLNMAANTPADAEIVTLDLDDKSAQDLEQHPADSPITEMHFASKDSLDFVATPFARKIKQVFGNSAAFDFSPWSGSIDFQFIDGGHDLRTAKSDTENALKMASLVSCIMWHDYHNWDYPELTCYLDNISMELPIFHIGDTMLCAWFSDPDQLIVPKLIG